MRVLIIAIVSIIVSVSHAQNFAVRFAGTNAPAGFPQYWPVESYNIGTNENVTPPWVVMTAEQIEACKATNRAAITAYYSNIIYQAEAEVKADLQQLVTAYSNLTWAADNFASATNIANLRIAVKATGDVLLKLKPVLERVYRRETGKPEE